MTIPPSKPFALVPIKPSALLLREVIESSLIERGAFQGLDLLGPPDDFWRNVPLSDLKRMATGGNVDAQMELAWRYYHGIDLPQDYAKTVRLLTPITDRPRALNLLAWCHFFGRGVSDDPVAAARLWQAAAEQGSEKAMFCLGLCHTFGFGVPRQLSVGLDWTVKAAEKGNREAAFELGEHHALAQDIREALRWWRQAARQGHARARLKVGHCYRCGEGVAEDKSLAFSWYARASEAGDPQGDVWLGECHEMSGDFAKAVDYYRRAALAGDVHGQAELGRCLLYGTGIPADLDQAESWLRKSAEGGWTSALGELERYWFSEGERHFHGENFAEAVDGYRKAACLGHRRAALILGECYRDAVGVAQDFNEAARWFRKATGLFDAKIALADMYYFGWGMACNYREALRWYEQALDQHEEAYAMYSVGFCYFYGQGTRRDAKVGLKWLRRAHAMDPQYGDDYG
ncbi:MAG: tetratricopeptide repeat protein [Rhodocyclaceae bacterium]|nr:tetratricopeptide repeat protein [Rhodocyclaceae bacterium]